MLRSLVAVHDPEANDTLKLMRNMSREKLEQAFERGDKMWLDLVDPTEEEIRWLEKLVQLNPVVVNDLLREDRRPALLVYRTHLFLSLFQPHIKTGRVEGREVHCLLGECFFITTRGTSADALESAYERAAQHVDLWSRNIAYFLYLTAQNVIDAYYPQLDRISLQLDDYEEKLLNGGISDKSVRRTIYRVKQQLINLRQMVAPQREVFSTLIGEARLADTGETRDLFQHLYERLLRIYDVIDAQRDLSSNVLDMLQNQESRRLVEGVNRLTILSMIFLPLTFLAGLFELGFATTTDPVVLPISGTLMFFIVVALMIFSTGALAILFRRRGWL